eukprot:3307118-Amphidinium_carterae.1
MSYGPMPYTYYFIQHCPTELFNRRGMTLLRSVVGMCPLCSIGAVNLVATYKFQQIFHDNYGDLERDTPIQCLSDANKGGEVLLE